MAGFAVVLWSANAGMKALRSPNRALVNQTIVDKIAKDRGATTLQIALAWLLSRKPWIVPIPGTTKLHRLEENLGAANVSLSDEDLRNIEERRPSITLKGRSLPRPHAEPRRALTARAEEDA